MAVNDRKEEKETLPRRRGPGRAAQHGYPAVLPHCAAAAVGSIPHVDPAQGLELVLHYTPEIPTWPQLPRRDQREGFYAQFLEGLPGLELDREAERLWVGDTDPDEFERFYEALEADDLEAFAISEEAAATLPLLLRSLEQSAPPFVKGQVTGPISLALGVTFANRRALLHDPTYREIISAMVGRKARWQEALFARTAPASLPLIVFDEPFLTQLGSAFVSMPEDVVLPLLEECLTAVRCLRGVHVCGGTDWERVARLPLDLLNFDAAGHMEAILANREAVAAFVAEGGLLMWGIVPTDESALALDPAVLGARVLAAAAELAAAGGLSLERVLAASFVSPACGTGTLTTEVAEACFRRTAETSAWLRASA